MNKLSKEDLQFLNDLQQEITNEDSIQRQPRFYVVKDRVREYWVDEDNEYDGICIFNSYTQENEYEGEFEYIGNWLVYNIDGVVKAFYDCTLCIYFKGYEDEYDCLSIDDIYELKRLINEKLGNDYNVCCYKDIDIIKEDTMFLTRADCDKHIKENYHHYNKPYSYSMTAWRNPKEEKLMKRWLETN